MSISAYQKILGAIRQWFEIALLPTRHVPVRVRIDEAEHHRSMSMQEYRIINQGRKQ